MSNSISKKSLQQGFYLGRCYSIMYFKIENLMEEIKKMDNSFKACEDMCDLKFELSEWVDNFRHFCRGSKENVEVFEESMNALKKKFAEQQEAYLSSVRPKKIARMQKPKPEDEQQE